MRKYLMTGMAALAICAAFTSCSKDTDVYNPNQKAEDVKLTYDQAFVKVFGQPAADQDWGFGSTTRAFTRGNSMGEVIKPDMTTFPGYSTERTHSDNYRSPEGYADIVAPITTAEAAWVQAWFDDPANAGLSEEGRDFDNFFVQQVAHRCYNTDKPGYFWEMKNGVEEHTDKNYNVKMDQLRIGPTRDESDAVTLHIYDFNAVDNGQNAWNLIYVQGGSSKQFGYHASYDNSWQWKFRCVQLTVPGRCFGEGEADRTGWYVGLSYWTDKIEVAGVKGERIGENDVNQGNDWILKIVPGDVIEDPEPDYTIRVIGEDLTFGEDLDTDFDFNDVVFDVATNLPKTWIKIKAAGGTLPLIIGVENPDNAQSYDEYEIHHLLGYNNTSVMINTNADLKGLNSGTAGDKEIELTKAYANAKDIPVYVKKDGAWVELKAQQGEPASKLGVDTNFRWCNERSSLKGDYPLFVQWVTTAGAERVKWY